MDDSSLSEDEIVIYNILKDEAELSSEELDEKVGFNKSKHLELLITLQIKN